MALDANQCLGKFNDFLERQRVAEGHALRLSRLWIVKGNGNIVAAHCRWWKYARIMNGESVEEAADGAVTKRT
jgi:hypothetical protein